LNFELNNSSILLKLNSSPLKVLHYVLRDANPNDYCWYSDKTNRELIMNKLEISRSTLEGHLKILKELNLLSVTEVRGKFRLNKRLITL